MNMRVSEVLGKGLKGAGSALYGVVTSVGQKKSRTKARSEQRPPKYNTWAGLKKNPKRRMEEDEEHLTQTAEPPLTTKSTKSSPIQTTKHSPLISKSPDEVTDEPHSSGRNSEPIKTRMPQSITATTLKPHPHTKNHPKMYRKRGEKRSPGHAGHVKRRLRSIESSGEPDMPDFPHDLSTAL